MLSMDSILFRLKLILVKNSFRSHNKSPAFRRSTTVVSRLEIERIILKISQMKKARLEEKWQGYRQSDSHKLPKDAFLPQSMWRASNLVIEESCFAKKPERDDFQWDPNCGTRLLQTQKYVVIAQGAFFLSTVSNQESDDDFHKRLRKTSR